MGTLVVTAAIIEEDGRYFIAQRKKDAHQGLKWEFPGGKVEKGESPEVCLQRELREELNLSVEVEDIYQVVSHNYGEKHIILLCYLCRITGGEPECLDCSDYRWVTPDEMGQFEFAPADIPIVDKIHRQWQEIRYKKV